MAECMAKVESDRDEAQVKARYFEHDLRRWRPRRLRAGLWPNARCRDFFVEANDGVRAINNLVVR